MDSYPFYDVWKNSSGFTHSIGSTEKLNVISIYKIQVLEKPWEWVQVLEKPLEWVLTTVKPKMVIPKSIKQLLCELSFSTIDGNVDITIIVIILIRSKNKT